MRHPRIITLDKSIWIYSLVFFEDNKHLLSAGSDGLIRQWRIEDGTEVEAQRLKTNGEVTTLALSADGNWIVAGGLKEANLWNRKTRQIAHTVGEHTSWVDMVDFSPDSTRFATGSRDKRAIIWNISNGKKLIGPLEHSYPVSSLRFSPDGNRLAVAVYTAELRIYNANNGQLIVNIAVQMSGINTVAWLGDSQSIIALSSDTVLKHICVDTGVKFLSEWTIPGSSIDGQTCWRFIAVSSNGKFVASFYCRSLSFWDTSTHVRFGPVFDHPQHPKLYSLALSPDNSYAATGTNDGVITIRDLTGIIPSSHRGDGDVVVPRPPGTTTPPPPDTTTPRPPASTPPPPDTITPPPPDTSTPPDTGTPRPPDTSIPGRIPNGTYRIKSNTGELYMTRSQNESGSIIVQPLDQSNVTQRWNVLLIADGDYDIRGNSDAESLIVGSGNRLAVGRKDTAWNFDGRGDAYVIGNAFDAKAIQLASDRQNVSVVSRTNNPNQRWVLERVGEHAQQNSEVA